MRFNPIEQSTIKYLVSQAGEPSAIYLFGSRVDDARKGGDIDLFLEPAKGLGLRVQLQLEYPLSSGCDIQIDLLVKTPSKAEQPFFSLASKGVRLL